MDVKRIITSYMGEKLKSVFQQICEEDFEKLEEIRIRIQKPVILKLMGREVFLSDENGIVGSIEQAYKPIVADLQKMLELMSHFSMYAFEEELRCGFITLPGGHRVGITGKVVAERGIVKTIKNINGINIRISHEVKGCADAIMPLMGDVYHTMIISPPGCGKTTLLRDVIRQVSLGFGCVWGQTVGVVDERSEIAGCYLGIPQNDVGPRTDVLDGCPKAEGMLMLLRSMAPQVLAVDEIGREEDIIAIEYILNAGIRLVCTVHGNSIQDILLKPYLAELIRKNVFQRFVVLKGVGAIAGVFDEKWNEVRL